MEQRILDPGLPNQCYNCYEVGHLAKDCYCKEKESEFPMEVFDKKPLENQNEVWQEVRNKKANRKETEEVWRKVTFDNNFTPLCPDFLDYKD